MKATPLVLDRVEKVATGDTYAAQWERTPVPERGPWLIKHEFRVYASKAEVTVRQGTEAHTRKLWAGMAGRPLCILRATTRPLIRHTRPHGHGRDTR